MDEELLNEFGRLMAILASDVKMITFFKVGQCWLPDPLQMKDLQEISGSMDKFVSMTADYNLEKENNHD